MTERLYYTDSYLRRFTERIAGLADDGLGVRLDRTAFYPASGGQPHDTGTIAGTAVLEVTDEGARVAHIASAPVASGQASDDPQRKIHCVALGQKVVALHDRAACLLVYVDVGA